MNSEGITPAELKKLISIEKVLTFYGASLTSKGEGRCLFPERHNHGDQDPSMYVRNGRVYCRTQQCFEKKGADQFALVGLMEDLTSFRDKKRKVMEIGGLSTNGNGQHQRQILRRFKWSDAEGRVAWKLRWNTEEPGKKCTWAQDAEGKYPDRGDCRPTLYGLDQLTLMSEVILVEGERDADTVNAWLDEMGLSTIRATCTPNGAGDVKAEYLEPLRNKLTIFLGGDNDDAGQRYLQSCGALLQETMKRVDLMVLRVPPGHKDWTDYKEAGGTAEQFKALLESAERWNVTDKQDADRQNSSHNSQAQPRLVLNEAALYGLAGDVVRLIAPHTEASPVALLVSFLAEFGCMLGRGPHLVLDGAYHPLLFWVVVVGVSSKSRKGSAAHRIRLLCQQADPAWTRGSYKGNLSSGEGLAFAVRDPQYRDDPVKEHGRPTGELVSVCIDAGVDDKRLFLVQSEFGSVLRVMARDGNSLSGVLREAWDGQDLAPMTKGNRVRATQPHIGIVGHVTQDELLRNLTDTEASNGFGNRFVWCLVERAQELPFSSSPDPAVVEVLAKRIREVLQHGRDAGQIGMTERAKEAWKAVYHELSAERWGLAGALLGRAEANVMHMAALYAVLDGKSAIDLPHLTAALAMWEYAEASTLRIFGDRTGDPIADGILAALRCHEELDDSAISNLFQRHVSAGRLEKAKAFLMAAGLAYPEKVTTGGRHRTVWRRGAKKAN